MTFAVRLCFAAVVAVLPVAGWASERMALVIGAANYQNISSLDNTLNDARAIGNTLEEIGFTVTRVEDASLSDMQAALDQFAFDSQVADVALIYYAGHGVELDGVNYMVPVDVAPTSSDDIKAQSVTLQSMLDSVDDARQIRIVLLDACRDNPFSNSVSESAAPAGATTSAGGLAPAEPDLDTLVVFAARDGQVAFDGAGNNSPFATALMAAFREPGLEIGLMFRKVRDLVRDQTGNRQQSYTYGSLSSESVYFIPPVQLASVTDTQGDLLAEVRDPVEQLIAAGSRSARAAPTGEGDSLATRDIKKAARILLNPADPTRYDPQRAVTLLQTAADVGDPEAMWTLSGFYEKGVHVAVDEPRALSLLRRAAEAGYDKALNDLGFMYSQGLLGLQPDQTRAYELFERAAEERHPQALFNFAVLIDQGLVPGKGPAEAAKHLFDANRSGQPDVRRILCSQSEIFSANTRAEFQQIMQDLGFYSGAIDAKFGLGTTRGLALSYGTPEEDLNDVALRNCQFT